MKKTPIVTVVVCTYSRKDLLYKCLESLVSQTVSKNLYEVLVIDNNSKDNTQEVVKRFIKTRVHIRNIKADIQGLSHARNIGWKHARGVYVAYIDDDAIAEPDWIEQIIQFINTNPKSHVFGGPYKRFSNKPIPEWFPKNWGNLNLGHETKILKNEWLSGSNIIFNKLIFNKYGGFNTDLGMKGDKILYGEETELLLKLKKGGEPIYYVPAISVKHLVADYKLNFWWLLKSDYFRGFSYSLLNANKLDLFRGLYYLIISSFMFPLCLFSSKKDPFKRKLYYGLSKIFFSLGRITGSFGHKITIH